ncbi:TonB-dependent copper receptor [Terasakiella pusilla]|uniref:TonB-dependent copper receptor n=1 Tax=Terasakiella pusilla TaxID=64973 RepID=UPI003AA94C4A
MKRNQLLWGAALCALLPYASASANDTVVLPEVVSEGRFETPERLVLDFEEDIHLPVKDGGDLLRSLPGVSGSRMGSHGIDPFIRGQKQSQINIIDDGVIVQGGCPNRMDPPSSFLSLEGNDELIVEKGYSSVEHGAGGCGGTVMTRRNAPVFEEGRTTKVSTGGGYDSNGDARNAYVKGAVGFENGGYVRANIEMKKARSYEDGNGQDVRAGFKNHGGRVDVGFNPTDTTSLSVGAQIDSTSDALFAGAGMDAPKSDLFALRGKLDQQIDLGAFNMFKASAYISQVEHIMDNFSLRDRVGMGMLTESETQNVGAKATLENDGLLLGADMRFSSKDALRYMGAQNNIYASGNEHAYMWPGMKTSQIGLFGEKDYSLSPSSKVKVGLRYDYIHAHAGKADLVSSRTNRSASDVYQLYYGTRWDDQDEHNVGGLIRFDHQVNKNWALNANLSRVVRTADETERAMAGDHATASMRWIGNPNIDPEQHHQFEVGSTLNMERWNLSGSAYYNKVSDYILRDRARGQDGVLRTDNANIYRNVDATLMGMELAAGFDLTERLSLAMNAAYTYGENDEDNRPLAQIAPLEFGTSIEYSANDWMAGLQVRGAARQTRADIEANNNSGLDVGETGGYAVFDLYGKVWAFEPVDIAIGVTNLFDKTYANHLNRASSFDADVTQVNEPGRSFFVRINADF